MTSHATHHTKFSVDNFPSFTELGHLPDWYEAVNSRRARQLGMQDEMEQKPRKTAGSLGVSGLSYAASWPGLLGAWNESAEN